MLVINDMEIFKFKTTQSSENYCFEISRHMVEEFNITHEEAVGRINDVWDGIDWEDDIESEDYDWRYHELPREWAFIIYFGHESFYWLKDKSEIPPKPYPKKTK